MNEGIDHRDQNRVAGGHRVRTSRATFWTANENSSKTMGYTLAEIQGKHHRMFVDPADRDSAEYREFWAELGRGNTRQRIQAHRQGRQGGLDPGNLQPDPRCPRQAGQGRQICHRHHRAKTQDGGLRGPARGDQQGQAVIEFSLDGKILTANENFLNTLGYSLNEVQWSASLHVRRARLPGERRIPGILG